MPRSMDHERRHRPRLGDLAHQPEPSKVGARLLGPVQDRLLDRCEVAAVLGIHPDNVARYARRYPLLAAGMRVTRTRGKSNGIAKWMHSAVMKHIEVELLENPYGEEPSDA